MAFVHVVKASNLRPLGKTVLATDLERGAQRSSGGVILPDDNMKQTGIRHRWAKIYAVGTKVYDLRPGDWVMVSHGRWTVGFDFETPDGTIRLWGLDYNEILLVGEEPPAERTATTLDVFRRF